MNYYKLKLQTGAGSPRMRCVSNVILNMSISWHAKPDDTCRTKAVCGCEHCCRLRLPRQCWRYVF